jgi:tRNA(fMet)-specific endonuclease VapC
VAAALARRGTPIGNFDTVIAAHALSLGLILVTNNVKHFGRVAGLDVENWM